MNVLITGCAGFIGSHACELFLSKNYNVVGVDSLTYAGNSKNLEASFKFKSFKFVKCDINDTFLIKKACKENNIEWIINFAAETHVDNSIHACDPFVKSNVLGVISLLNCCRELKIKLLHVSTDEVYGSADNNTEFDENSPLKPKNPYSASKAAADHFIDSFANTYNSSYIIVRPSNNYGPRQHSEKLIPTIVNSILSDKKVPVYGDGKQKREWTFVKDTVVSIEYILRNSSLNQIYNITSKIEKENLVTVNNIANLIFEKTKKIFTGVDLINDRPGHDKRYSISSQKLKRLGWEEYSKYEDSLSETIDFYLQEVKL